MNHGQDKALEEQIEGYSSAYSKGHADWFKFLAEDATVHTIGSVEPFKGRAAFEKNFKDLLTKEKRHVVELNRDVRVMGDTAVVLLLLEVTQSGVVTILRESLIWKREGHTWKVIHIDGTSVGFPRQAEATKDLRTIKVLAEKIATVSAQVGVAQ